MKGYFNRKKIWRWIKFQLRGGGAAIWGVIAALFLTFAADLIRRAIDKWINAGTLDVFKLADIPWMLALAGVFLTVIAAYPGLKAIRRLQGLTRSRAMIWDTDHPECDVFIFGMSFLKMQGPVQSTTNEDSDDPAREVLDKALARLDQIKAMGDEREKNKAQKKLLEQFCDTDPQESDFVGLTWQQPIRVLHNMKSKVKVVGVFRSSQVSRLTGDFERLVTGLFPDIEVESSRPMPDLEDYNKIDEGLSRLIRKCLETSGTDESSVCIDITGANKVYTAAATIKTLNNRAIFSYASTDSDHIGQVRTYDAVLK